MRVSNKINNHHHQEDLQRVGAEVMETEAFWKRKKVNHNNRRKGTSSPLVDAEVTVYKPVLS